MNKDCGLCTRRHFKSGQDVILNEDEEHIISNNGNTHLRVGNSLIFAKKRITITIKEHKKVLSSKETKKIKEKLDKFLKEEMGLVKGEDYFLKITMGNYPDHFHLHAYIFPLTDKGEVNPD
jgi:hypothetical protein